MLSALAVCRIRLNLTVSFTRRRLMNEEVRVKDIKKMLKPVFFVIENSLNVPHSFCRRVHPISSYIFQAKIVFHKKKCCPLSSIVVRSDNHT
jgi:hypothetical protein